MLRPATKSYLGQWIQSVFSTTLLFSLKSRQIEQHLFFAVSEMVTEVSAKNGNFDIYHF